MDDGALPPANRAKSIKGNVHTTQRTRVAVQTAGAARQLSHQRPKSTYCDFRESRRWAQSNAEWIGDDSRLAQPTLDHRRASDDLLRSPPIPAGEHSPYPHNPSHAKPPERAHNRNYLNQSLKTGNWLNRHWDTAQRKIQVRRRLGRFVRKVTDTGNWVSKEPAESLGKSQEQGGSDRLAPATLHLRPRKASTRCAANPRKTPGMNSTRARKEATSKAQEKPGELTDDGVINLYTAGDALTRSDTILALWDKEVEETKRKSAHLQEVLATYQSDRHGNLLPENTTNTMSDLGAIARQSQQSQEQRIPPESPAETHDPSEQFLGIDSVENIAWTASDPSSGKSTLNSSSSPLRPGLQCSSALRGMYRSPLAGYSAVSTPARTPRNGSLESAAIVVPPPGVPAGKGQAAVQPRERASTDTLSVFGPPPAKSTDTLVAITSEALGDCRSLTPFRLTETQSVAVVPPPRPTKLRPGLVTSAKAPSDAPNRPLPDLPEVPTPDSPETTRRDASSRALSQPRRPLQPMSPRSGHNRRTSSLASITSLDGVLERTTSPCGPPQRKPKSAKKSGSVRSSLQKRSSVLSSLTDAQCRELTTIAKISEARSPGLRQAQHVPASTPTRRARDTASRDQRIHDKRLQDIASARAKRGRKATCKGHQRRQDNPAAEDFPPPPPSSRPPRRTTVDCQKFGLQRRIQTANASAVHISSRGNLWRSQSDPTSLTSEIHSLAYPVQTSQMNMASDRKPAASSVPFSASLPASISSVTETQKSHQGPGPKQSYGNLRSNVATTNSQILHSTPTPALSESSTPSSDEDGTGVVGATNANRAKVQQPPHLSASDVAAIIADMHSMREQLNEQMRKIQAQSKQIRAIEMQKIRMLEAVNALVAAVSEPFSMVPVSSHRAVMSMGVNPHLGWPGRDSVASTSNTAASADTASSGSESSGTTFITEPEALGKGLVSREGVEFNMDFDRMQELIRLDRRKAGPGVDQEDKSKRSGSESSGLVRYLRIGA